MEYSELNKLNALFQNTKTMQHSQFFLPGQDSSLAQRFSVSSEDKQWSMVLFIAFTPLPLQRHADSWDLIWNLGTESQGSENHHGWGESKGGWREERELFFVVFGIVNPLEWGLEIPHISTHCIIPSSEANCVCKLALSLKRQTQEGYGVNAK